MNNLTSSKYWLPMEEFEALTHTAYLKDHAVPFINSISKITSCSGWTFQLFDIVFKRSTVLSNIGFVAGQRPNVPFVYWPLAPLVAQRVCDLIRLALNDRGRR